jgi:hypothetical protein
METKELQSIQPIPPSLESVELKYHHQHQHQHQQRSGTIDLQHLQFLERLNEWKMEQQQHSKSSGIILTNVYMEYDYFGLYANRRQLRQDGKIEIVMFPQRNKCWCTHYAEWCGCTNPVLLRWSDFYIPRMILLMIIIIPLCYEILLRSYANITDMQVLPHYYYRDSSSSSSSSHYTYKIDPLCTTGQVNTHVLNTFRPYCSWNLTEWKDGCRWPNTVEFSLLPRSQWLYANFFFLVAPTLTYIPFYMFTSYHFLRIRSDHYRYNRRKWGCYGFCDGISGIPFILVILTIITGIILLSVWSLMKPKHDIEMCPPIDVTHSSFSTWPKIRDMQWEDFNCKMTIMTTSELTAKTTSTNAWIDQIMSDCTNIIKDVVINENIQLTIPILSSPIVTTIIDDVMKHEIKKVGIWITLMLIGSCIYVFTFANRFCFRMIH